MSITQDLSHVEGQSSQNPEPRTQDAPISTHHSVLSIRWVVGSVVLLTIFGLALRLFALGHGLPNQYVPDESTMVGGALRMGSTSSLQPNTFIYPALMMYLFAGEYLGLLVVGRLTGLFASIAQFKEYAFIDPTFFYLLPRLTVALAGAATIPMAYLVGKRLYGRWAGVAAAALLAASVMHVQMSHQARHWAPVTLLTLVVLWFSMDLAERGRRRDYWICGLLIGLTAATSYNGFLVMLFPLIAHLMLLRKRGVRLLDWRLHMPMLITVLLAPVVFFVLNPYILLQFGQFASFQSTGDSSIGGQIRGHFENFFSEKGGFPFFAEATIAYEPAITLLGFAGAILVARRFRATAALVLVYPFFHYFMFSAAAPSLEQRYMLPAVAVWALPAGVAVEAAGRWLYRRLGSGRGATTALASLSLLLLFLVSLPSLRYDWLLSQKDTRTLATEWIERNIPAGSDVAVESYSPPLTSDLETLRAQQQANPKSLGARDQWILEKGLPAGEVAFRITRLNLIDTTPTADKLTPYLATHSHRYFVVTDFRWKSEHVSHLALKSYLAKNGRLLATFAPSADAGYAPSDILNNMEDPISELFRVERPGPTILVYEVSR